ncbi:MAG: apolipoprotein N-acyltransferase [Marinomonas sp.]
MADLHPDLTTKAGRKRPAFLPLNSPYVICIIGLLAGALGVTSFSPYYFWPSYFITLMVFTTLTLTSPSAKAAFWRGSSVGLGFFGAGISWVFVSIDTYGQVGDTIATLITLLFVLVVSVFWSLSAWLSWHLIQRFKHISPALLITFSFLLGEFARSHLFTGFPWLLPGYAIQETWLYELLPIGGIWLTSAIVVLTACLIPGRLFSPHNHVALLVIVAVAWTASLYLHYLPENWVTQTGTIKTTLVQGNVEQDEKWLASSAAESLEYYKKATKEHLDSDLVVWPETAITYLYQQINPYLVPFKNTLVNSQTTLITGVPDYDPEKHTYYNAMWATGNGFGLYYKRHLVPFGEYIPFSSVVGPILDIFGMPMSSFLPGDANQPVLQVGDWAAAPFICYEIVYPEQVRQRARESDFLINISNDGWFGASIGPWQHLQIAQFRAKETGRYLVRATNTGMSVIVDENGHIISEAPQFKRTTLTSQVKTFKGATPYVEWGYWPVLLLLLVSFILSYSSNKVISKRRLTEKKSHLKSRLYT